VNHIALTRRRMLMGLLAGGAGLALAACGGAAAPASSAPAAAPSSSPAAPPSAAASAKPAGSAVASAKPAGSAAASPAASGSAAAKPAADSGVPAGVATTWDDMVAAAKKEGKVVVNGPPDPAVRDQLPAAFKKAFGIDMEFLGGNSSQLAARVDGERKAGQYTVDASVSGSDTMFDTFLRNGWLDPLKPSLLLPDVADNTKWKPGGPWFREPEKLRVMQIFNTVQPFITLNTQIVPVKDIPNADALLDPKWKGKIAAYDPGVNGAGIAIASAVYTAKGEDYVTKLYKGQNVVLTRDYSQLADWVAHGSYPIGLAATINYLQQYIKAGLTFEQPELPDAPSALGGGFGDVAIWNKAPHPNAARVFANWIASKEGIEVYGPTQTQVSVRTDVDNKWAPPSIIPKPGIKYLDTYDYDFEEGPRLKIRDFLAKLLK
jgi:iron(III) transport system substrate-binding protein